MTQTTISYITNNGSIIVENPPVSHFFLIDENNEYLIDAIDYDNYDGQGTLGSYGEQYPLPLNIYSCDGNLLLQDLIIECFEYDTFSEYMEENPNTFTFIGTLSNDNKVLYIGEVDNNSSILLNFGNKTVSSLYINNKEVQSIITSNNVVLYEKVVTPIPIPETITLSASKDIISYAHNELCTLTLQYPPGYTINIYNNSTNVLLGTMTDKNNNTYQYTHQATGNGDITFRAEIDNKSTTYTIKDVFYYNSGKDSAKLSDFDIANIWNSKNQTKGTTTITTDNTEWITITRTGGTNYGHIPIPLLDIDFPFKFSYILEMITTNGYNGSYVGFYAVNSYGILVQVNPFRLARTDKGSSDNWKVLNNGGNVGENTYKHEILFNGTSFTHRIFTLDGTQVKTYSTTLDSRLNNESNTVEYGIHHENRSFRIKELMVEKT